jgi:radical SAM-linked protein
MASILERTMPQPPQPIDIHHLETQILPHVFKPGRYMGFEQGAYNKPFDSVPVRVGLVFPELYEIGFSNYAHKLFYSLLNQLPNSMCDRAYAPDLDIKALLTEHDVPLFGVETKVPLKDFDLLAFSLQYELNYTTILGTLEAAQIPLRSVNRETPQPNGRLWPILIAGGPGCGNPIPLAPFFDAFIIGDGEEIFVEIADLIESLKKQSGDGLTLDRDTVLSALAQISGIFIPGKTERAYKRIVDIKEVRVDIAPIIPTVGAVHDRVVVEARRGCDRMCRFCQPCFINLPVREQSIENIKESALKDIEKTGYEECSLLSLSIADYSQLKPLITEVASVLQEENASLSLPSQRADRFNLEVAEAVQSVRKSSLTFAPEAGTARMRDVVNKNLTDAEIMNAVITAYKAGWNKVKLYFMIGLPTETEADLDGIVDLVKRLQDACRAIRREEGVSKKTNLEVNVTLSNFVPKPHTPFQWFAQDTMTTLREKNRYLKDRFKFLKGIKVNATDPEISKLEAVISKGDAALADVIEDAYQRGAYLDAWDNLENFARWFKALEKYGIDPEAYTRDRACSLEEPLPWDCIDVGLEKDWLKAEYLKATEAASTTPCFDNCSMCGVCANYNTWPTFMQAPPGKLKVVQSTRTLLDHQMKQPPAFRYRLKIEKKGPMRFMSHLDWLRMIHRTFKRSRLPVAYTQGFNPGMRISFGPAIPLFMEGLEEYLDVDFTESFSGFASETEAPQKLQEVLNDILPKDGKVLSVEALQVHGATIEESIQSMTYSARWTCKDPSWEYTIVDRVNFLAQQETIPVDVETKKSRKSFDIAPYLRDLRIDQHQVRFTITRMEEPPGQYRPLKPEWILQLIHPDAHWSITRDAMVLEAPPKKASAPQGKPAQTETLV